MNIFDGGFLSIADRVKQRQSRDIDSGLCPSLLATPPFELRGSGKNDIDDMEEATIPAMNVERIVMEGVVDPAVAMGYKNVEQGGTRMKECGGVEQERGYQHL